MGGGSVIIETAEEVSPGLLEELKGLPELALQEKRGKTLIFTPPAGTEVSDIINLLVVRGVRVERADRKEASLEEMYSAILKEVEPA